jgi:formylglycine-generating enzyme required for sulfatase activity
MASIALGCVAKTETRPAPQSPDAPRTARASVAPPLAAREAPAASAAPPAHSAEAAAPPKRQLPPDMLEVPGGTFDMGANDEGEQDERPAHRVTLASFLLDQTEVTNAAYAECVKAGKCRAPDSLAASKLTNGQPHVFKKPDHPVVGVAWSDAKAYCEFNGKRLPREAEWERAARGSDGRRYVWGNDEPDPKRHGVFGGQATTRPVRGYPDGRGPYGHFDLAGNVWEWLDDEYDPYAYRRPSAERGVPGTCAEILVTQNELRKTGQQGFTGSNPIPFECEHVLRGGAYNYRASGMRASNRVHHPGSFRIAVAGFRCAKDAE